MNHIQVRGRLPIVTALILLVCWCYCPPWAASSPSSSYEQIWFGASDCSSPGKTTLTMTYPEQTASSEPIPLTVEIWAPIPYQNTRVILHVEDHTGATQHYAEIVADLHRGRNDFTFNWSAETLAHGDYFIITAADYADNAPLLECVLPFSKVSADHWRSALATHDAALARIRQQLEAITEADRHAPYAQVRLNIAGDAHEMTRHALTNNDWPVVARNMAYLEDTLDTFAAGFALSNSIPELHQPLKRPSLDAIAVRDGGFYTEDTPVFFYGGLLNGDLETVDADMARLKRNGLNFAVLPIPLSMAGAEVESAVTTASRSARNAHIGLAIQFDQNDIVGEVMDQWPEILEPGFVNMAHPQYRDIYFNRLASLLEVLRGRANIIGVSIANNPHFKYDGEPVRLQFIEQVKERYPDRIDLNRLWRAHLADYDEITIWGEHPEHKYQNRRAYQYEWQRFHRELITRYFADLKHNLVDSGPDIPVMLTLPDTAFTLGETRYTPNREQMAAMMDINGAAATAAPGETLYSINYPKPHAYYTLLRSYSARKPILNLHADIDLDSITRPNQRYALVRSVVWESAMSGVSGLALPMNSAVFSYPEGTEGFASASMDVNRLGEIVRAFQQAPAPIAILFSEASKIMDDGGPHLESAHFAFEGASFAGFAMRYVTESQIETGALATTKVLILPDTLAVSDETFKQIAAYVESGGMVARVGTPIPYNERGQSRGDVIRATANTVLVRGMNLPTEYLHALDAALDGGALPQIARPINAFGYPLEGVRSRYIEHGGEIYLYIINLRKKPVNCYLTSATTTGRDLIQGRDVHFPRMLMPLEPMLIRMERRETDMAVASP